MITWATRIRIKTKSPITIQEFLYSTVEDVKYEVMRIFTDLTCWHTQSMVKITIAPYSRILDANGGGRGPRTKPALSPRGLTGELCESLAGCVDNPGPIHHGISSARLVTTAFVERVELELF